MNEYLNCILVLIALMNPVSKIFVISTLSESEDISVAAIRRICIRASAVAGMILMLFAFAGNALLSGVFHVTIYSFQIFGGMVLLYRGALALNRGIFFEKDSRQRLEDMSIVPLASPMIAGPATLTAAVSFPPQFGMEVTLVAILAAIIVNMVVMMFSGRIGDMLKAHNLMGALIRVTGLIVATIGVQMMLDGIRTYISTF